MHLVAGFLLRFVQAFNYGLTVPRIIKERILMRQRMKEEEEAALKTQHLLARPSVSELADTVESLSVVEALHPSSTSPGDDVCAVTDAVGDGVGVVDGDGDGAGAVVGGIVVVAAAAAAAAAAVAGDAANESSGADEHATLVSSSSAPNLPTSSTTDAADHQSSQHAAAVEPSSCEMAHEASLESSAAAESLPTHEQAQPELHIHASDVDQSHHATQLDVDQLDVDQSCELLSADVEVFRPFCVFFT
jgi:hypothetical protein